LIVGWAHLKLNNGRQAIENRDAKSHAPPAQARAALEPQFVTSFL